MKRFLVSICALALLCSPTWGTGSGGLINSFWNGGAALTFLQCDSSASGSSTHTFLTQNTGTATADRYTVVGIFARDAASAYTVDGVTVGGDAATETVESDATSNITKSAIYIVANAADTSETVAVTFSESVTESAICLWSATGLSSATATDTASSATDPATLDLDTLAGGIVVGMCGTGITGETATWTGLTERAEANNASSRYSGADTETAAASTPLAVQCNMSGSDPVSGASASWR